MFISQTGFTYFYKWPITCEIQILNLIKCGSGICNRCDQRLSVLASRFFRLAKSLWNQGRKMAKQPENLRICWIVSAILHCSCVTRLISVSCFYSNMADTWEMPIYMSCLKLSQSPNGNTDLPWVTCNATITAFSVGEGSFWLYIHVSLGL
jgi:hypothetical protein